MHIFEIYKLENASVLYNFQIKERDLFLFSSTHRTDKWLSLENWSYIYKKVDGIAKKFIDNNKQETGVKYVPGDLKLTIKFQAINGDIKKLLNISNYKYEYYLKILIDYVSDPRVNSKPEKYREYSPSLINNNESDNHYTPKPTTKPNNNETSTYKPARVDGKNSDKDEYIPESGTKDSGSPDISYKPTKIEELSQTSSDGITGAGSKKRRRIYESLNEDFLGSQNRIEKTVKSPIDDKSRLEYNNRKQKGKDKKKSKLNALFSQSDSESNEVIEETPPKNVVERDISRTTKESLKKSLSSSTDFKHKLNVKRKKNTETSKSCNYTGLTDGPLLKNKFNCHKLTISEIKDSFKVVKPKLDKCIDSYYNVKRRLKLYCEDPLIIHELFTETQATCMYQQLQDTYLSNTDTGANFADLFTQVLLPAWALHLSSKIHNIPEDIISKLNVF